MTHAVPFDCPLRPDQVAPSLPIDERARERPPARGQLLPSAAHRPRAGRLLGERRARARARGRRVVIDARGATRRRSSTACARASWGARGDRAVPGSGGPARRGAGLLPAGRRRGRAPPRRRGRRRAAGGARSRAAGRRADRHQGHLRHARDRDHLRLQDPARVHPALRVDGDAAAGRRPARSRSASSTWTSSPWARRTRTAPRADAQPLVDGARAGRLVGRLGGGGRRVALRGRDRDRHRRLDPAAGRALRRGRDEADLRSRLALRRHRLRLLARSPGAVRSHASRTRRRCWRSWPASIRSTPPRSRRRSAPTGTRRAPGKTGWPACGSACRTNIFSPAWTPRSRPRCAPRSTSSGARGPRWCPSRCRTRSTRSRPTTSSARPRRRRTWRATTASASATARPA